MGSLLDLYCLAEQNGIPVDDFKLGKTESVSMMDISDHSCYIALDPEKIISTADEYTKLAHELGHCMTGSFYNEYSPLDIRQKHENVADRWAIEHVIPLKQLCWAMLGGYSDIQELADYFNVSPWFVHKAICWYAFGDLSGNIKNA